MRPTATLMLALFLVTSTSLAFAQSSIKLRFDIQKNGATVGQPEVAVTSGTAGNLTVDGIGKIAFTPTSRDSESLAISFNIESGGKQMQPRVVLRGADPGSVSWTSADGAESFKFVVVWVR